MEIIAQDTASKLVVNPEIFNYDYNESLIHQAVVAFMNAERSGNSAQKSRSEVSGGGRKPWKQKGTGRARAGSIRSPLWKGGGVTFASKKRDYTQKLNKKMYIRALRSIFSELNRQGSLILLSDFQLTSYKTKAFKAKMNELGVDNALVILNHLTEAVYLGSRNLNDFYVTDTYLIDPVTLLRFNKVIITEEALKNLERQLQ